MRELGPLAEAPVAEWTVRLPFDYALAALVAAKMAGEVGERLVLS